MAKKEEKGIDRLFKTIFWIFVGLTIFALVLPNNNSFVGLTIGIFLPILVFISAITTLIFSIVMLYKKRMKIFSIVALMLSSFVTLAILYGISLILTPQSIM